MRLNKEGYFVISYLLFLAVLICTVMLIFGCSNPQQYNLQKAGGSRNVGAIYIHFLDGRNSAYAYHELSYQTEHGSTLCIDDDTCISIIDVINFRAYNDGSINITIYDTGTLTYPYTELYYNDRTVLSIINGGNAVYYGSGSIYSYFAY